MKLVKYLSNQTVYGTSLLKPISRSIYKDENELCFIKIEDKNKEVIREKGIWKLKEV